MSLEPIGWPILFQSNVDHNSTMSVICIHGNNRLMCHINSLYSKFIKEQAYMTLLRPSLEYACTVWDPHTETDSSKLDKIQRRAARWVLKRHRNTSSVGEMLDHLQWPKLSDRRLKARLTMMYRVLDETVSAFTSVRTSKHAPNAPGEVPANSQTTDSW